LEHAYLVPDPWNLASEVEQARFRATNKAILAQFGKVGTLLEIGSGEGHQSQYLTEVCDRLYGVEVSQRALSRAQARVPNAEFSLGDFTAQPWVGTSHRFDLVVACEVAYYFQDIRRMFALMSQHGDACFVSFFSPAVRKVGHFIDEIPNVQKGWIHHGSSSWLLAWWRNAAVTATH
jgi:cyclopropane fatty-acyl-phospholipid synthase-like methyltransferase